MPMFILMGGFAVGSGLVEEIYAVAYKWFGGFRGGLYLTTIAGQAAFGGISGSTIVDATVFTRTALPQMLRYGYPKSYSSACIAATGSFAAMIPPSITMVIYGIITEVSVGRMLIAGILPGLAGAAIYMIAVTLVMRVRPDLGPPATVSVSWRERLLALRGLWPVIVLFGSVLGGLYTGLFPPSGAGAAGAFGMFLIAAARRRLRAPEFWHAALGSAMVTALIFFIIIGGLLFSRLLLIVGFIDAMSPLVLGITQTPLGIILLFSLMYLFLGCLIDTTSMMIMTLPFVYPVIRAAGIDGIWFGIIDHPRTSHRLPAGVNLVADQDVGRVASDTPHARPRLANAQDGDSYAQDDDRGQPPKASMARRAERALRALANTGGPARRGTGRRRPPGPP
jgi:tripartite ATP-independent transporter DctM subunit